MNAPLNLIAIVGSLRADSSNRAVFETARELSPDGVTITERPLRGVPLYDGDVEAAGDPQSVVELKAAVDAADGLLIFTPEYNRSVPAVTKNAIDWLSRLPGDSALSRAVVGIVAASPGGHTAAGVREHLSSSIRSNTAGLYEDTHGIGRVASGVADGRITDDAVRTELAEWLEGFVAHVRTVKAG